MSYYLCRLNPPRPTFAADMTETEAGLMAQHAAYWTNYAQQDIVIVFGPVADPKGVWGVAILNVNDEAHLHELISNDLVILANIGMSFETFLMPRTVVGNVVQS